MTNPDDTSPDTSPDTSDAPDDVEPRFSQADVNRIVTDRLARANRAATTTRTAPRSNGGSLVRRALAFSAAGYSDEECETFASSSEYALPAPPPASARLGSPRAASTTAPTIASPYATGALVDVSRMSAAELSALGPQGVAKAIAAVMESGRARDGRPQVPSSASLKRTR